LTGEVFARLAVIERGPNNKQGRTQWLCQCICGKRVVVLEYLLQHKTRPTRSCGCLKAGVADDINKRIPFYRRGGFQVEIIHTVEAPTELILHQEAIMHGLSLRVSPFEHLKYRPMQRFGGYTECFQDRPDILTFLCEFMDDINGSDGRCHCRRSRRRLKFIVS